MQEHGGDALEVAVAGERDEQVEQETLAVFVHLRAVVIHTWRHRDRTSGSAYRVLGAALCSMPVFRGPHRGREHAAGGAGEEPSPRVHRGPQPSQS